MPQTKPARIKPVKGLSISQHVQRGRADLQERLDALHRALTRQQEFSGELLREVKALQQGILARDLLIAQLKQQLTAEGPALPAGPAECGQCSAATPDSDQSGWQNGEPCRDA